MTGLNVIPPVILVAVGGATGAVARWLVATATLSLGVAGGVGTAIVNLLGCFAIGVLVVRTPDPSLRLLVGTGVLGGFTTFSTFSLDAVGLAGQGRPGLAAVYVIASVGLGLLACLAGQQVGAGLP